MGGQHVSSIKSARAIWEWPCVSRQRPRNRKSLGGVLIKRNLAARVDIPTDVLRQRRDLYALAIGLMLFSLAGGSLKADTSFGNVLPLTFSHPYLLLWAAWAGFFYFWFRFWLISEARPIGDFLEDVRWQAGNTFAMRRIAAEFATDTAQGNADDNKRQILSPTGYVPVVSFSGVKPLISLNRLRHRRGDGYSMTVGPGDQEVPRGRRLTFWLAYLSAFPRAIVGERAFTDYTLPHAFALLTLIVGIVTADNHVPSQEELLIFGPTPRSEADGKRAAPTQAGTTSQMTPSSALP